MFCIFVQKVTPIAFAALSGALFVSVPLHNAVGPDPGVSDHLAETPSTVETSAKRQVGITGQWTARFKKGDPGAVEITFLHRSPQYGLRTEFETIPTAELRGVGDAAASGAVEFKLEREAGTFNLEGHFSKGRGSGEWTLSPDPHFISAMSARGYGDLSAEDLYSAAIADLNIKLIDDLKQEGYDNLSFHDLFEAAAFGITPDFIRGVKAQGVSRPSFERLVQIRVLSKKDN